MKILHGKGRGEMSGGGGEEKQETGLHLQRNFGLLQAVSVSMGVMIGCTIFITPASVTQHVGSVGLSLVIWGLAAVIMLLQAICLTELAVLYPHAGGMYAYLKTILGPLPAFLYAWYFCIVCQPAFMAFTAIMISSYIIMPIFHDCHLPEVAISLINIWIIVTLVFMNSFYLNLVKRMQSVLTVAKFIALVGIVIVGIIQFSIGKTQNLSQGFQNSNCDMGSMAVAVYTCMTNYAGWEYLLMLTEEVKDPSKTIPKAIYTSFFAVGSIFILVNVAYFTVLSPTDMMASQTVAVVFSERTLGRISGIIPIVVAMSAVGALNAVVMGGSRVCFAAARDNMFPQLLSMISIKHKTPLPAIIMTCVLSSLWSLWGNPLSVIEYLGFTDILFLGLTISSLLYIKIRHPNIKTPYKVPLFLPIISLMILVSLAVCGLVHRPITNGFGLIPIFAGIPVYFLRVLWPTKSTHHNTYSHKLTKMVQRLMMVVMEEN